MEVAYLFKLFPMNPVKLILSGLPKQNRPHPTGRQQHLFEMHFPSRGKVHEACVYHNHVIPSSLTGNSGTATRNLKMRKVVISAHNEIDIHNIGCHILWFVSVAFKLT